MTTSPWAAASAKLPAAASRPSSRWAAAKSSAEGTEPQSPRSLAFAVSRELMVTRWPSSSSFVARVCAARPEPMMPMSMSSSSG